MIELVLKYVSEPWDNRGFAWVHSKDLDDNGIHFRQWFKLVARVPVVGKWLITRILRHEIDHVIDPEFRYSKQHHEHVCGRNTNWYSVFSNAHLLTSKETAWDLFKNGKVEVTYLPESKAHYMVNRE